MPKTSKKIEETPTSPVMSVQKNRIAIGALLIAIVIAIFYFGSKLLIVAIVNGQPISRLAVINDLEKQSGKKALDSIISQTVILQEAKKQKITIAETEIDTEIKKIDKSLTVQGQNIDTALASRGMTMSELRKQIMLQKMLEKMVGANSKATDKEIDAFIKENAASIPKGTDSKTMRQQVAEQLQQDKLSQKIQAWVQDHVKKSNITYLKQY